MRLDGQWKAFLRITAATNPRRGRPNAETAALIADGGASCRCRRGAVLAEISHSRAGKCVRAPGQSYEEPCKAFITCN